MSIRNRINRVQQIVAIADAKAKVEDPKGLSRKAKVKLTVMASLTIGLARE